MIILAVIILLIVLILANYSDKISARNNIYRKFAYFDNNGTTQPHSSVIKAMRQASNCGNPSAGYASYAKSIIQDAKTMIESRTSPGIEIIFNSGASEGNNQVLRSFTHDNLRNQGNKHLVISSIEHITSIECAKFLSRCPGVTVTFVKPTVEGIINPEDIRSAVTPDTVLVSVMHVNNETGAVNNIAAIGEICGDLGVPFHVDAVQSFGKHRIPMKSWGVNFATVSFHKLGGPSGVGALLSDKKYPLNPMICGTQNNSLRGGTENIVGIAGSLEAMRVTFRNRDSKNLRMREMKESVARALADEFRVKKFCELAGEGDGEIDIGVREESKCVVFLGPVGNSGMPDPARSSPNTLMFSVVKNSSFGEHFCNNKLQEYLRERGVVVSVGSACSAKKQGSSHVLVEMKAPFLVRCGVIRVSIGDNNTKKEAEKLVKELVAGIKAQ